MGILRKCIIERDSELDAIPVKHLKPQNFSAYPHTSPAAIPVRQSTIQNYYSSSKTIFCSENHRLFARNFEIHFSFF